MTSLKKILLSKWLRIVLTMVLFYFAFRKVSIINLFNELRSVPWWFLVFIVIYQCLVVVLGSYRWSLLLFERPKFRDILVFTKSSFYGLFYSLVFPTGVAGDLLKWLPLKKEYPELSSAKLLSSSLVDRIVGFTAFIMVAFVASILGRLVGVKYPSYLLMVFGGIFVGVLIFYAIIFNFDIHGILSRFKILEKPLQIIDLLKDENKGRLLKCIGVAFISEFAWITPIYLTSNIFSAGMSLLSVYVIVPIIALILVLPISVAGFGARENLYLLFFGQMALGEQKILLVSTFTGIISVVLSLIGGILTIF